MDRNHEIEPCVWLVFPAGVDHPADRERRGTRVGPCYWRPAMIEGARLLGLLLEEVEAVQAEERRARAA